MELTHTFLPARLGKIETMLSITSLGISQVVTSFVAGLKQDMPALIVL